MGAGALDCAWLKSTFHDAYLIVTAAPKVVPREMRPGILEKEATQVNLICLINLLLQGGNLPGVESNLEVIFSN